MVLSLSRYTKEFWFNLTLAFPVIIGLLGHAFVQLVDNIMVGQLGTAELAAVSLGNSFFFVAMSLGIGFSTAITPLIAETDGANDINSGRKIFIHGLILCIFLGILLTIAVLFSKPLLYQMGQPEEVVELAYPYLQWVGISLIPLIFFQGFKQFSEGLSHTRPAMYATLIGNIINVVINYFLIFGIWIFPKMGVEGAAIGTMISRILALIFMIIYLFLDSKFLPYLSNLNIKDLDKFLFKKILKIGFPSAAIMFFEISFFLYQMNLELKKFNMKDIKFDPNENSGPVIVLIGRRDTGKSFLVRDLLFYHQDIPIGTVISLSGKSEAARGSP